MSWWQCRPQIKIILRKMKNKDGTIKFNKDGTLSITMRTQAS